MTGGRMARRSSYRRVVGVLVVAAAVVALVALAQLLLQSRGPSTTGVATAHFKNALDDLTNRQDELCGELARTQRGLARQYRRRRRPNTDLVRKSQPKYTYDPPLTLKTSGVVLTSYFSNMEDPLYQDQPYRRGAAASHASQAFGYMDLFHNTATSLELPVVVFHDALTPAFVRQHNTSLLRFVQVPGAGATSAYSQNDLRFEVFLDWLQCCASVDYILLADIRDTRFARDPLALMAANAKRYDLYFNSDRMNDWMEQRFAEIQHPLPQYQVVFNAGVWGGKTAAVHAVLAGMVAELDRLYSRLLREGPLRLRNFDMAVLNTVALGGGARDWRIAVGPPFCGGQVMCELFFQCHYFVYHKHLQPGELPPCKLLPLLTAFPPRLTTATWGMLPQ